MRSHVQAVSLGPFWRPRIIAKALSDVGATLVVVVVQELPLMESKPTKALGRPAKTDVRVHGLGASPMLSSIK